jgi:hypothetical protein
MAVVQARLAIMLSDLPAPTAWGAVPTVSTKRPSETKIVADVKAVAKQGDQQVAPCLEPNRFSSERVDAGGRGR